MARGKKKETILTPEEKLQEALVPESEWPYKIPENWRWVYGRLCFLPMESKKPSGDLFKYIDIDSIDNKRQAVTDPKIIEVVKAPSRASRALHKGDTIFSMVRPYLKNIAYIDDSLADSIASTGFYVCSPKENIDPKYIYYLMVSPYVVDGLNSYMKGDNSPSIRKDDIEMFQYPLPPLPEQQRIVDRIESLFVKLDEAKEKAQAVVDGFEDRKAAILHKAFTGELTAEWRKHHDRQEKGWTQSILKDCSSAIGDGLHGTPVYDDNGEYWFINGNNLSGSLIEIKADTKKVNEKEYKKYWIELIPKTTVLLSINGTLGKTAFYNGEPIILGKSACYINTKECLDKYFLRYYFMSKEFVDYTNLMATGSTIKNLGLKAIRNMPINLPHIDEQVEIVRLLDNILVAEEQAKESAEQVIDQIDTIKKSILARAFRGGLGTNDPSDESAEELLKRIL